MLEKRPINGLRFTVRSDNIVETVMDSGTLRVIVDMLSDIPDKDRLIKHYYVWLSEEYVEDSLRLSPEYLKVNGIQQSDIANVAMDVACQRFEESGMSIPTENGADCTNENGIVPIQDAINYIHPTERKAMDGN